jgi:glutaredoxin 3
VTDHINAQEAFMTPIVIYTKSACPYCDAAKDLLLRKGAPFEEVSVDGSRELQGAMSQRAGGRRTVPQIFIGERHVGGYDDLYELDHRGELDPLLTSLSCSE